MLAPLLVILAKYGYLPSTYSNLTIHAQLEKLITDAINNERLIPAVQEINRALGLDIAEINETIDPEWIGPYCEKLMVNLEIPCSLTGCKNNDKAYRWNCQKLGTLREELLNQEVVSAVSDFTKGIKAELLNERLPSKWKPINCKTRCGKCGSDKNLQEVTKTNVVCKECIEKTPGKFLAVHIEFETGRPILDILSYIIKTWHSVQEQSTVLGITAEEMQELCDAYCLNPKRYKTMKDRYFANPFHTRRKGRPTIDSSVFRLYHAYMIYRRVQPVREEILNLNHYLLDSTNKFLASRELMQFNITAFA